MYPFLSISLGIPKVLQLSSSIVPRCSRLFVFPSIFVGLHLKHTSSSLTANLLHPHCKLIAHRTAHDTAHPLHTSGILNAVFGRSLGQLTLRLGRAFMLRTRSLRDSRPFGFQSHNAGVCGSHLLGKVLSATSKDFLVQRDVISVLANVVNCIPTIIPLRSIKTKPSTIKNFTVPLRSTFRCSSLRSSSTHKLFYSPLRSVLVSVFSWYPPLRGTLTNTEITNEPRNPHPYRKR